ncbi:MAG: SPFH domain-containing protein [Xanthomonadaceae bacterium]|jgi:regulator of protease activity HflC (stomatin/prohibitin superfamily)|nr:SPFH domain-containing protein [Xanthomonadaceae bacterium]
MQESKTSTLSGIPVLIALLALSATNIYAYVWLAQNGAGVAPLIANVLGSVVLFFLLFGFFMVQPNTGVVLQLFGRYVGTSREEGLRWANPFYSKKPISLRVRNFESGKLKVNDLEGSPIEIGAIVVWQVHDTAEAVFKVDDCENFVHVQSEAALRQMATSYPYDLHDEHTVSLRSHSKEINAHLQREIQERLGEAGVTVIEARISHLAYAQEIAQAMLQRQQASAIIAARTKIVEGAVSMVHMALEHLEREGKISLDDERKAAMVSNLLVVLCGERGTQPIVNTGTLYG